MRATARAPALVATSVCVLAALFERTAQAAELPDATLVVTRSAEAAACPDETTLAQRVASRLSVDRGAPATGGPLLLNVAMTHEGGDYVATVEVDGRKQGVRTLRAEGPTCAALQDALVVALLVLLDADPSRSEPEPPPEAPAPQPAPPAPSPREPEPELASSEPLHIAPARPHPTLWVGGGWEISHGLPVGLSGAALGEVALKDRGWQVGAAFLWAPERSIRAEPGAIDVSVLGGRLSGCYVRPVHRRASVGACALGQLLALSGRGVGDLLDQKTHVRPWVSAGAGALLDVALSPRITAGIGLNLLATLHRHRFSVEGIEDHYETDAVTGGGGMHFQIRLW